MSDRDYKRLFKAAQIALQFITKEYSSEREAALDGDPLAKEARPIRDALLAAMYGRRDDNLPHGKTEKVAMAICLARYGHLRGFYANREQYEKEALAALAAIREALKEPTDAMIDAGDAALFNAGDEVCPASYIGPVWKAMLSAALLEGET